VTLASGASVHNVGRNRTTWVSRHQKGKNNLNFNKARDDGEAVASDAPHSNLLHLTPTPASQFLHAGCSSRRPINSIKAHRFTQQQHTTTTTTTTILRPFVQDYQGELVPKETFTHPPT